MNIKAVSFDLDDTLWPLLPVILKAEKDTNQWLIENYPGVENLLKTDEVKEFLLVLYNLELRGKSKKEGFRWIILIC